MKWLLVTLLAVALAGCADRGDVNQQAPITLAGPTGHTLSLAKSVPRTSLAARVEASKTHTGESTYKSSLMECVSEACKAQCVLGMERRSRPKWCMYFKQPIDRRALSATAQRKSAN